MAAGGATVAVRLWTVRCREWTHGGVRALAALDRLGVARERALPDATIGWVHLHADGGHPGANPAFAAIRRFTAPAAGRLSIQGTLGHGSENGDGVRGRIVSSARGVLGEWSARTARRLRPSRRWP